MPATDPPLGHFHQVDGRSLWLHVAGVGGPAAVFLPGGGAVGLDYWAAHQQIAQFTIRVRREDLAGPVRRGVPARQGAAVLLAGPGGPDSDSP